MRLAFEHGDSPILIEAERQDNSWRIRLPDGSEHIVAVERLEGDILRISYGESTFEAPFAVRDRVTEIAFGGAAYPFTRASGGAARTHRAASGTLAAPMVGLVTDVPVSDGQRVAAYQPIAVIEAMKVLATIEAPFAGTVKLHVAKGQQVDHGAVVAEITPHADTAE